MITPAPASMQINLRDTVGNNRDATRVSWFSYFNHRGRLSMVIYFDRLTNAHFSESFLVPVESEKKKNMVDHPPPSQDIRESPSKNVDTGVNKTGSLISKRTLRFQQQLCRSS